MRSNSLSLFILRDSDQNHKAAMKRKREKLDHLSEEEKLLRRKIKNRVSAQTARDRKKAKLHELEIQVEQLSKANSLLSKRNQELEEENANLKSQFSLNLIGNSSPSLFGEQSKCGSLESAAFIYGSQPKNQELRLASSPAWTRILIFLSMAMTAMISSSGYINAPKIFWKQIHSSPARKNSTLIRHILLWLAKLNRYRSRPGSTMYLLG